MTCLAIQPREGYVPYTSEQIAAIKAGGRITPAGEWDCASVGKREAILLREKGADADLSRCRKRWYEDRRAPY